jgi:hypothetical protein
MNRTKLQRLLFILCTMGLLSAHSPALATVIEQSADGVGTMAYMTSGTVTLTDVTVPLRAGTTAHKHTVSGSSKRAEVDDNSWHAYAPGTYFYGMSYYIPADGTWTSTTRAIVAQWRFSNIAEGSSSVVNCSMYDCSRSTFHGGSGGHLLVDEGNWTMSIAYQDPACTNCAGMLDARLNLGAITQGVWTDFIIEAKWTHLTSGYVKVWRQVNGGGYTLVTTYTGSTWFNQYQAGSNRAGQTVKAPNFTVGHYWSNDSVQRTIYTDEIRVSNSATNGYNEVKVSGTGTGLPSTFSGDYKIINSYSGLSLRPLNGGTTDNTNIVQQAYTSGWTSQQWTITDVGSGLYEIKNVFTGKLLRPLDGVTTDDAQIVQFTDNNWGSQRWTITDVGGGLYEIKNSYSGKLLRPLGGSNVSGTNVVQFTDNNWGSQRWLITRP